MPFLESINLQVNVIAQVKFELSYDDVAVKHVSHFATVINQYIVTRKGQNTELQIKQEDK